MQNFVDISDGKIGTAIMTRGLREYEVEDDSERTVKITLIRTQRAYMTANSKMNVEELDKYTGQHSFGTLEYDYAIYPHTGNWQSAEVLNTAYAFKVPVKAAQGVPHEGSLPVEASFITVSPEKQVLTSALKLAENGQDFILRIWNTTGEALPLEIKTILPIAGVERVRLDETQPEPVAFENGAFGLTLAPHKIETFLLKKSN